MCWRSLTALAVSLWLSALNVLYRDVQYVIPFLVQLWMFVSPVIYPISKIPAGPLRVAFALNPMTGVIGGFRWALLGQQFPGGYMWISIAVVARAARRRPLLLQAHGARVRRCGVGARMSDVVLRTVGLGKMYHIGGEREQYRTLRDTLVQTAKRPIERIRHPGAATHRSEELWALRDVDLEVRRGEVLGVVG